MHTNLNIFLFKLNNAKQSKDETNWDTHNKNRTRPGKWINK